MPNPTPGTLLGAYRVEGTIGAGSMGDVYRAIDTGLNRRVAIKILSQKHRDSPELRQRFVREGRAVAAISHPNVVQVFATGQFDDRPYIAMELLDGTDLGSIVEKAGALGGVEACHAILDAAQGLAAAAKAGLIHRDVKPSNLVRLSDGQVKVTDFGLAKPVDPGSEPALTAMGVVVGTPDYIAPEQARGEPIDERVDIYALGGTLYFLLVGTPPYRTGKPAEDKYLKVVARHLKNPPPDAAAVVSGVDRELSELAKQMMAKRADDRPSYAEIVERTTQILARLDPSAIPPILSSRERSRPNLVLPTGPQGPSARVAGASFDDALPRRSLPVWLVMLTLACLALFAAGLVVYLQRGPGPAPAAKPTTTGGQPAGMLLVRHPDGSPWVYADVRPVAVAAFRRVFVHHAQPGPDDGPVVDVSYDQARSYATSLGGRLLTSAEWDAAARTPGFTPADGLSEWVESPGGTWLVRRPGKEEPRPDTAQADVTFRVGRDL